MSGRSVIATLLGLLAGLAYLATGWTAVPQGEAAVVRRLGRVLPQPWSPGPHWGWPLGFDQVVRVRTDAIRRLSIGLAESPGPTDPPGLGEFLTGDLNLLRVRAVVQYRVADPVAFVLRSGDAESVLTPLAESSLSRALARRGIDAALRTDRVALAQDAADELARSVRRLDLGLSILGVSLTETRPPSEVQPDFDAAQSAQSAYDRRIHEARAYVASSLPAARATAQATIDRAHAAADRAVALAGSRAARFRAILDEAHRSRRLTVFRIYRDAMRDLVPRVRRKLLLPADAPLDLSILGAERRPKD